MLLVLIRLIMSTRKSLPVSIDEEFITSIANKGLEALFFSAATSGICSCGFILLLPCTELQYSRLSPDVGSPKNTHS